MGFKQNISPAILSLQIAGLLPTGRITIGGHCVDEQGKNSRPPVPTKHLIYPLIMAILGWGVAFRMLMVFFVAPKKQIGDIAYDIMFVSLYFVTATMRTSFLYANWDGNKWLKILDHLADGDYEDMTSKSKHPLAVLVPIDEQKKVAIAKRSRQLRLLNLVFWNFIGVNVIFLVTFYVIKRDAFSTLTQPFSFICQNEDLCYYPSLLAVGFFMFVSDMSIFCNGFTTLMTFEYAHRFHDLHKWIDDSRKDYLNEIRDRKRRRNFGHNDDGVPTVNESETPREITGTFEVEKVLRAHLNLWRGVRKLDKAGRVAVASSMSFGFVGILVNMYQMGWGTQDSLLRTIWGYWTCCCLNFLFTHLVASSILNSKTVKVQESLFRMPTDAFALPSDGDERPNNLKLSLLLGQFGTEPIALTFMGMFFLRTEGITQLCGELMAYFLLLIEIAAGEKRGFFEGLKKCESLNATKI